MGIAVTAQVSKVHRRHRIFLTVGNTGSHARSSNPSVQFLPDMVELTYVALDRDSWRLGSAAVSGQRVKKDGTLGAGRMTDNFWGEAGSPPWPTWLPALVEQHRPTMAHIRDEVPHVG